jgi:hypothetical protein
MVSENKKPLTWAEIENILRNSIANSPGETNEEKLACFKKKIIDHLDTLQEKQDKKIIPFPPQKNVENEKITQ